MLEIFDQNLILIIAVIFASSLIRSTFGFGDALVAMPIIAIIAGIKTATPLVAIIGFTISVSILIRNWKEIDIKSNLNIIFFSIIGLPIGLYYLVEADENIIKMILAIILILFALYNLFKPGLFYLKDNRWAFAFGILAGALGGAYNTNGPPIIIFGAMRRWTPEEFRLILQGIFTPINFFIIVGHGINGLWTEKVLYSFLYCLPFVIIAIIIGGKLNKIIPKERFAKYIYIFLIIIGAALLYNSM